MRILSCFRGLLKVVFSRCKIFAKNTLARRLPIRERGRFFAKPLWLELATALRTRNYFRILNTVLRTDSRIDSQNVEEIIFEGNIAKKVLDLNIVNFSFYMDSQYFRYEESSYFCVL